MPTTSTDTKRSTRSTPSGATDTIAEGSQDARVTDVHSAYDPETREALIRLAAYSFYERRGFVEGHELEDWLQAEMEIDRRTAAAAGVEDASSPAPN
jgi:hypothetical protein